MHPRLSALGWITGLSLLATPLWAAETNKAKIEQTCKEYALEDKISPDEMEAYVQQCVQDLLEIRSQEDTLPNAGDVPVPPAE